VLTKKAERRAAQRLVRFLDGSINPKIIKPDREAGLIEKEGIKSVRTYKTANVSTNLRNKYPRPLEGIIIIASTGFSR
jgi:hypothetical protein